MKERIFVVRVTNHRPRMEIVSRPLISVSYIDANNTKHGIESFALKVTDVGIVAGELIHRLIPQLGDK